MLSSFETCRFSLLSPSSSLFGQFESFERSYLENFNYHLEILDYLDNMEYQWYLDCLHYLNYIERIDLVH